MENNNTPTISNDIFRNQIKEDITLIQEHVSWDKNAQKDEYAFNYWVLSNMYKLDIEVCHNNITEYNDKGIDCFVHYEENKELYIIQNKYYDENTALSRSSVADFITTPINCLSEGNYKKSPELQKIYDIARNDSEYKIFLHFYVTNDKHNTDADQLIKKCGVADQCELFYLSDIKDKYYGKSYQENPQLKAELTTVNKGTLLAIRPNEYDLPNMSKSYYVMATIESVYNLWSKSENSKYPLFEKNIREYLGGTSQINKAIIKTLEDPQERYKFFYYNNGITIICDHAARGSMQGGAQQVTMENPQVVNGCQTVSSIAEVFKKGNIDDYKSVYVMVKILVIQKNNESNAFYRDVVKYTNSQNAINEKIFAAAHDPFFRLKEKIEELGFLLIVKQSDKFQLKKKYECDKARGMLLEKVNKISAENLYKFNKIENLFVPLETLLQIIGAYKEDAYFAYTKKSSLLKPTSQGYQNFSTKINDFFTTKQMVTLIILYKKAEYDKKQSDDKRSPSPFYLLNFLGRYLENKGKDKKDFLSKLQIEDLSIVYETFKSLPSKYMKEMKEKEDWDYNYAIKCQVNTSVMDKLLFENLEAKKEHAPEKYEEFTKVFDKVKSDSQSTDK